MSGLRFVGDFLCGACCFWIGYCCVIAHTLPEIYPWIGVETLILFGAGIAWNWWGLSYLSGCWRGFIVPRWRNRSRCWGFHDWHLIDMWRPGGDPNPLDVIRGCRRCPKKQRRVTDPSLPPESCLSDGFWWEGIE